jgi:catechol 2,3-dioxygenase-like lactoylglutathione lyase family enzyme
MKRFHVHIAVENLDANIRFYSQVFGAPPTVRKPDYAKWMIEDPRVNFAISEQGLKPGLDHLGLQVDSDSELDELHKQIADAQIPVRDQPGTECCYARGDKYWIIDPQGVAWETFHTLDSIPVYGSTRTPEATACCSPATDVASQPDKSAACCG